jgi:diguanylate cyclase (GGDEF)-like protein
MKVSLPRPRGTALSVPVDGVATSPAFMARVLAGLFTAGGALSLIVAAIPGEDKTFDAGYFGVGMAALFCALVLRVGSSRMPSAALPVFTAIASVLISLVIFLGPSEGGENSSVEMLYLWGALFSAYFFTRAQVTVQITWMAMCYWFALALGRPSEVFASPWGQTFLTLGVAAFLLQALRERVAQLVARLTDAARTDPLTGLHNRRGFEEQIMVEVERARRHGRKLAVVVGDLDHFKRFNDRLGHPAGDAALMRMGQILLSGKRQIDMAARTGGEEFAVLLPDTTTHGGLVVAERLRTAVEHTFADDLVPLTFSLGVASFPEDGSDADGLLVSADRALYAAKHLGRNRAVVYSEQIATGLSLEEEGTGEGHLAILMSLAEALDVRDTGTADHSETVGRYCEMTARELGMSASLVRRIRIAGVLHDIGKIGLPDAILQKPGPLTEEEWAQVRRHPEIGAGILGSKNFEDIRSWVFAHHERPDGTGYPRGLKEADIPLEARILAVADAYEAMTADRVYRPAIGHAAARAELSRCAGTQFDREVVEAFLSALDRAEQQVTSPAA